VAECDALAGTGRAVSPAMEAPVLVHGDSGKKVFLWLLLLLFILSSTLFFLKTLAAATASSPMFSSRWS
jgi:hypothetical protein